MRIAALKREEDSLSKERERLEAEKMSHIRSADNPLWGCAPDSPYDGKPWCPTTGLGAVVTSNVNDTVRLAVQTLHATWLSHSRSCLSSSFGYQLKGCAWLATLHLFLCVDPLICMVVPVRHLPQWGYAGS